MALLLESIYFGAHLGDDDEVGVVFDVLGVVFDVLGVVFDVLWLVVGSGLWGKGQFF